MKLNNQQFPDKKLESFKAKTNRGFQDNLQKLYDNKWLLTPSKFYCWCDNEEFLLSNSMWVKLIYVEQVVRVNWNGMTDKNRWLVLYCGGDMVNFDELKISPHWKHIVQQRSWLNSTVYFVWFFYIFVDCISVDVCAWTKLNLIKLTLIEGWKILAVWRRKLNFYYSRWSWVRAVAFGSATIVIRKRFIHAI